MKTFFLKGIVLLSLFTLSSFSVHKYYLSVTNITAVAEEDAIQITSRIFIDDLESLLETRYGLSAYLNTKDEEKDADKYIEKYLHAKFEIKVNGKTMPYVFLGREYIDDQIVCYLEIEEAGVKNMKSLTVYNEMLTDLYQEQQNIVHIKAKGKKKSFVLIKENNKGMLNF